MPKSARGEVVYQCDVCTRRTRVPLNLYSFDVVQRCIITLDCPGKLYPIKSINEINNTPVFSPEVPGLQNWFQRNILYNHTQAITNTEWVVVHNLGSNPLVQVLVDRFDQNNVKYGLELTPDQYDVVIVDLNTVNILFSRAESGIAQCIGTASTNLVNPQTITQTPTETFQITNNGELTIATTSNAPLTSITIVYKGNPDTIVTYLGIDNTPSIASPWVGADIVHIAGRNYTVRSFNVVTTPPAPAYFGNGLIRDGSSIYFQGLSSNINENFLLLSNSPYAAVDKITDRVLDIATIDPVSPVTFYNKGDVFVPSTGLKSIYPPVIIVA